MSIRVNSLAQGTMSSLRNSQKTKNSMQQSMEKLSSGKRINQAADDAAGLAVALEMGEALEGIQQGMRNVTDGLSVTKVASGALQQSSDNLNRMRELAMTAANGTLSPSQRDAVESEFNSLKAEITQISQTTEFNGRPLLDGSAGNLEVATGGGGDPSIETLNLDLSASMDAQALGLASSSVSGSDGSNAQAALADVDAALGQVSSQQAQLGSFSNRLESTQRSLSITAENTFAARSNLQDVDVAVEMSNLVRDQVLGQINNAVRIQSQGLAGTALTGV